MDQKKTESTGILCLRILWQISFLHPMKAAPAEELFQALRSRHIYVRYFPKGQYIELFKDNDRNLQEMETLITFLKEYLGQRQLSGNR